LQIEGNTTGNMEKIELYEDFFDSVSDVILFVDAKGNIIDINKAGSDLTGYEKAELGGMNLYKDLLASEDIPKMKEVIDKLVKGLNQSYTIRWRSSEGDIILFDGSSTAKFDKEGNFLSTTCILREGYLNQFTKTKLEKSQDLLKKAQHIGKIGHWELNFETNELIWSEQIYDMFGIDSDKFDASYAAFLEAIHPDDRQMVDDAYNSSVKNRIAYSIDHRIVSKSGELKWVNEKCETTYNKKGNPVCSVGTVQDITAQKQIEEKLLESEKKFRTIVTNSTPIVFMFDTEGTIVLSEGKMLAAVGLERGQVVGMNVFDLYKDFPETVAALKMALGGEVYEGMVSLGDLFFEAFYSPNINSKGEIVGVIGMALDVTGQEQSRKELRANEELFRSLAENSQAHILLLNRAYEIQYLNHTMPGLSVDDFLGISILDFVPIENQSRTKAIFDNCFSTGNSTKFEREFLFSKLSALYHFEVRISPIFEGEKVVQLLVASTDITERKTAEQKLEKSLDHLHLAMDAAKMGTFEWNVKEDESFWSEEVMYLFGTTSEEFGGSFEAYLEFIPEESRERISQFIGDFIKVAENLDIIQYEHEIIRTDGETAWIEVRAKLFTDDEGRAVRLSGLGIDITERKQAEKSLLLSQEKLRESEGKFRAISEQASEAITIADLEGNYTFVNPAFSEMMGYSEEELLTMTVFDMKRDPAETDVFKAAKNGAVVAEIDLKRKDGSIFLSKVSGKPIFVGDEELILGIITDIDEERAIEEQLKESRQQFEDLFDSSPDSIFLHDYNLITNVNQAFLKQFGYESKEDVIGKAAVETIVFPEDVELMWNVREELENRETAYIPCIRLLKSDGSIFMSESRISTVVVEGKVHLQITNRDITERKVFEKKLMKSEATLQAIQDHSPALISIKDKTGVVLMANKQFEVLKGFKREEFVEKRVHDIFPKDIADELWANDLKAFETDASIAVEEVVEHEDGTWHTYLSMKFPIYIDSNEPLGVCAISTDITEQKKLLQIVKESELKYKDLFDNISDGMCILDKKGNVLHHNPAFSKILGYDDEDWNTITIPEIVHPDYRDISKKQYLRLKQEGVYDGYETKVVRKDKSTVWVQANSTAIYDDNGKFIGSNDVIRNITERKKTELELSKTQEMLKQTSQVAQVGGWEVDFVEDKVTWSDVTRQIHEVPMDYVPTLESSIGFYKEGESRDAIMAIVTKAVEEGRSYDLESKMMTAKNREIWVRGIGQPEFVDGECIRLYGTFQDITQQKKLEEDLEKANEAEFAKLYRQQKDYSDQVEEKSKELNRFFELSSDMICIVNIDGVIQRLNPALVSALGYTEEEMLYEPLHKFLNSDDREETVAAIAQAQENDGLITVVNRYQTKDGDFRWFSWHAIEDPISGMRYAVARDITEEKKANKEIEDLKNTLDQIAIIIIIDNKRNIVSVNDKFCEASGYSRDDVVGEPYNVLKSNYHSKEYWLKLRRTVSRGNIWRGEMKTEKKDGSFFWADTYVVPFYDEMGKIFQFIAIQSDITGRKKLEKDLRQAEETALKSAEIKENFLANMSHEIRTPMNAILGFSRLLLLTEMASTQHDYAQAIYDSAENLLVIINDILDFSKIESGKFKIENINYDLTKTIDDVLNVLKAPIQEKNLELILDVSPEVPQYLIGAPNRIAQVLINLVGNAVKFTPKGYIKIIVTKKNSHWLLFEVKDTGIGIPAEKLESIFDSFTQAENNTTRMYGGTGLGLSISKKIVSLMGGDIYVKSEVDMGSTFSFELPFKAVDSSSGEVLEQEKQITEISIAGANILVVEDNKLNQELMIIYLKMLKCNCDLAVNGQEAVDMALKKEYDLIFMDIQMPIMDGLQATKLIREQTEETPIIAMTAHALKKERQKCFDIGMNDYLGKPFRKEELEEMIVKHISEHVQLIEQPHSNNRQKKSKNITLKLSVKQLSHEVGGDEDMVKQVLLLFKEEVNEFNEMMQKAIAKQDLKTIAQIAHKVKPNFQLLQLNVLVEIILEIEKLVADGGDEERVYGYCREILTQIPMVQLQIAEELV